MNFRLLIRPLLLFALLAVPLLAFAGEEKAPTAEDHMNGLVEMCAASAEARAQRHTDKSLYERLGGYDRILEMTTEVVRLHTVNDQIKHTVANVDKKALAKHVADFMAAGIGGTAEYTGRDLKSSHVHLELTDADFLAAGGDIITAMRSMDYGQEEIDEVVCMFVGLKDQVVFK
jgi:hemoglobin